MKILILEDQPARVNSFQRLLTDHDVFVTNDARECIELLGQDEFDILFLDHDLGGPENQPELSYDPENCGSTVANWLHRSGVSIGRIYIHSLNYPASIAMMNILKHKYKCAYVPFAWQDITLKSLNFFS